MGVQNKTKAKKDEPSFNSKAVISSIEASSAPAVGSDFFSYEIIRNGSDNLYQERVNRAIDLSPTASGCTRRFSEFILGQGFDGDIGNEVVNREGETLNEVLSQSITVGYARLFCFALHLNFNLLGEVIEIFAVDPSLVRKCKETPQCRVKKWNGAGDGARWGTDDGFLIDSFRKFDPVSRMAEMGVSGYHGQLMYFSGDGKIYPKAPLHTAILSAEYQHETQVFQFSSIKRGFSAQTLIKVPTNKGGAGADDAVNKLEEQLKKLHGAEHAGRSVLLPMPVNTEGALSQVSLIEQMTPPDSDKRFVNQNREARDHIISASTIPRVLLGIGEKGLFSRDSFVDAYNLKIMDTEQYRQAVASSFRKVLDVSVWKGYGELNIVPQKMMEKNGQPNIHT